MEIEMANKTGSLHVGDGNKIMYGEDLCGCGKPVRYMTTDNKGACSKYGRCPTYEELSEMLKVANLKLFRIKQFLDEK